VLRHRTVISGGLGYSALATFYFAGPGAGSAAEATEVVARVRACFLAAASVIHFNCTQAYDLFVDELDPTTGEVTGSFGGLSAAPTTGTGSADPLPNQIAMVGQFQTGHFIAGRQVQGRTYLGALNESDSTGVPSPTATAALTTALGHLSTLITTPVAHVVWHRPHIVGGVNQADGAAVEVTTYSTAATYGTQRGRRV